jgi:hypothetical protein
VEVVVEVEVEVVLVVEVEVLVVEVLDVEVLDVEVLDVEVVVVVVELVLVVEVLDVEVVVVVATQAAGGGESWAHAVGSLRGTIQEQVPALHAASTALLQSLRALPERPPSMAVTSSEQFFPLQVGAAALAPETKTPAASATVANMTAAPRAILVIFEPPPMAVPTLRSISALYHRVLPLRHACQGVFGLVHRRRDALRHRRWDRMIAWAPLGEAGPAWLGAPRVRGKDRRGLRHRFVRAGGGALGPGGALGGSGSLQWQAQSKPHAPLIGTAPHVIPGGQVPHWQKLHVIPLSLGSPQGIASPVQPHVVPSVVQVMAPGHNGGKGPPQVCVPPPQAGPMPQ